MKRLALIIATFIFALLLSVISIASLQTYQQTPAQAATSISTAAALSSAIRGGSGDYILANNISWTSCGRNEDNTFTGTLNGNGKTITLNTGYTSRQTTGDNKNIGLMVAAVSGTIKNCTIILADNPYLYEYTGSGTNYTNYCGILAGALNGSAVIDNVHIIVNGSLSYYAEDTSSSKGGGYGIMLGGFCGRSYSGAKIQNSSVTVNGALHGKAEDYDGNNDEGTKSRAHTGGFVGEVQSGTLTITNCALFGGTNGVIGSAAINGDSDHKSDRAGGVVGAVRGGTTLTVNGFLYDYNGGVTVRRNNSDCGLFVGRVYGTLSATNILKSASCAGFSYSNNVNSRQVTSRANLNSGVSIIQNAGAVINTASVGSGNGSFSNTQLYQTTAYLGGTANASYGSFKVTSINSSGYSATLTAGGSYTPSAIRYGSSYSNCYATRPTAGSSYSITGIPKASTSYIGYVATPNRTLSATYSNKTYDGSGGVFKIYPGNATSSAFTNSVYLHTSGTPGNTISGANANSVTTNKNVGTYTCRLTNSGGTQLATNTLLYANAANAPSAVCYYNGQTYSLTVSKRTATLSWANTSFVYDGAVHTPTASLSNLVSGDSCNVTVSGSGTNVGTYTATATALSNGNYALPTSKTATLTISKRAVAIAADAKSKTYGDADPALTYKITSGSLVSGEAFSGALSRAVGNGVDTYAITQNTLKLSSNYSLTYTGANLTITQRPITLSAIAKSKTYGAPDPSWTYNITTGNLVYGDTLVGGLTRAAGENIGQYAITQGNLTTQNNPNYTVSFVENTFTINSKSIVGFTIAPIGSQTYTGGQLAPTTTVKDAQRDVILSFNTDFSYIFGENINAANGSTTEGQVQIIGKGNYKDTVTIYFDIAPKPITYANFAVDAVVVVYTGFKIMPTPQVSDTDRNVVLGAADFSYDYAPYQNINTSGGSFDIVGKNNYTGRITIDFTIIPKDIALVDFAPTPPQTYTSRKHTPTPNITDPARGALLTAADFYYTYGEPDDNIQVVEGSTQEGIITIVGKGNYTGTKTTYFDIVLKALSLDTVTVDPIVVGYSGIKLTPTPAVRDIDRAKELSPGFEFVFDYTGFANTNVSEGGKVRIVGIGNYSGSFVIDFDILQKDVGLSVIRIATMDAVVFTGSKIRLTPGVTDQQRGVGLVNGIDYTYGYGGAGDNINVEDGSTTEGFVAITGIGNYTGTQTAYFDILPKTITISGVDPTATVAAVASHTYTGFQITPEPAVSDRARALTLAKDADFVYLYDTNTNVVSGSLIEGTITISGIGNYTGSVSVSFDIAPKTLVLGDQANIIVADIASREYTGYAHIPEPAVTDLDRDAALVKNNDFAYVYGTNIDCTTSGTTEGSVSISGMGNYTGSVSVTFDITPKEITAAIASYDEALSLVNMVYNGRFQNVVATPVGVVQRDIDNATVPLFDITYSQGRPFGVLADDGVYPVAIALNRNVYPNYDLQTVIISAKVAPKPIAVAFYGYTNLVYDGTQKEITSGFANIADICLSEQGVRDPLQTILTDFDFVPYIGEGATIDFVKDAGAYTVAVSLSSANYVISNSNVCTFEVARKEVVVRAEDRSKYFGDPDNTVLHFTQRVASGTADGEIIVVLIRDTSGDLLEYESYGTYKYTDIEPQNNYSFTLAQNSGYFTINKRMIGVVPRKHSKVYGEQDPQDLSQSVISSFDIKIVFGFVRFAGENVGVYPIYAAVSTITYFRYVEGTGYVEDNALSGNFRISEYATEGWFTINKRPIDVTMGEFYKIYGFPDPKVYEYEIDTSNLADQDKDRPLNEVFPDYNVTREPGEDVKTGGYGLSLDLGNNNYSAIMNGAARLIIRKQIIADHYDLTEIFDVRTSKVYDGSNKAGVTTTLPDILKKTGFGVTATYSQKNAGTGLTISLAYKMNNTAKINFELPQDSVIEGCEITKRKLTAAFDIKSAGMIYGNSLPVFTLSYSGYLVGDSAETIELVEPDIVYGSLSSYSGVGSYTITLAGNNDCDNYYLDISSIATVTVLPAPIEVHPGEMYVRSVTKNESREATLSPDNYYFTGIKNNDVVNLSYVATLDSGSHGMTKVRVSVLNIDNLNYTLVTKSFVLDARLKPLPVIKVSDETYDYDGMPKSILPSVKVGSENLNEYRVTYVDINYPFSEIPPKNAGSYLVTVETTSDEYDVIIATATLHIKKITPTITISGTLTQVYGNFRPLSAKVKGFDFEQIVDVIYPFDISTLPPAGTYTVKAGFDGADNYWPVSAEENTATLTITQKAISASFTGYKKLEYDGKSKAQEIVVVFNGVLEDESVPYLLDFHGKLPINAGSYTVTVSSDNPNYRIAGANTLNFTIAKRSLKVYVESGSMGQGGAAEYVYGFEGFAEGDDPSVLDTLPAARMRTMFSGENEVLLEGGSATNYEYTIDNTQNAKITIEYKPKQPKAGTNTLLIILSAAGGLALVITIVTVISKGRTKRSLAQGKY